MAVLLVMAGEIPDQEVYDEGRLVERMMIAASVHGVGAGLGWISGKGGDQAKQIFGIPSQRYVRTVIGFGYPSEEARKPRSKPGQARKPLSQIVHNDHYRQ